ncbi:dihydrofolate reductase [Anoxybacillus gonensis]|uniref:Dihydrofolate reductase n=1 Tax=Anoxybacillus gonensis TaxID=198467 RepID=A0AAW7TI75_9BACL|nr:dihydrofolate reductase [Anoxybacillus gonensis]AKS38337.1 dihydrofolate reductase [Anoxybacillus gonensis]KGP60492.1 dihydrofolate reductase [Anoxybacillus gonensis]MCX8046483.1 dihydrofolate reductase [Anoxybacillus gonensis]MDO0877705.1 dihydrofolate reductase [Anoxybacillus gonensis]
MISIIVAMDRNRVIGWNNTLPWHLPADLAYFKHVTMGHPIVMGRKTFESIGRPLPGRINIVLTRHNTFSANSNVQVIHSIDDIEQVEQQYGHVFVIGGAQVFEQAMPFADQLYVTHIDETFTGDTFFPPIDEKQWVLRTVRQGVQDEKNRYPHTFCIYERTAR